jgi:glutathione S-transferase
MMLIAYGNLPIEHQVVNFSDWPTIKANKQITPLAQLPVFQLPSGESIPETAAIARYFAKLAGAYPEDPVEAMRTDAIWEMALEMNVVNPLCVFMDCSTESWAEAKTKLLADLPRLLSFAETQLSDKPFIGGDKPQFGEFYLYHVLTMIKHLQADAIDAYPSLHAWLGRFSSIPAIAAYLEARPKGSSCCRPGSFFDKMEC